MRTVKQIGLLGAILASAACGGGGGGSGPGGGTREWTIMVYMAADNSLAAQGIFDIDEMEAAGTNAAVQTVVQAEFSKDVIAQYNGCDASCFHRPNFNTFRYAVTGQGANVIGPNGSADDIGNVDMTSSSQLQAFVQWAKTNFPANHYLLVLWNHGGGYTGLIQDQTSAGSNLMTLDAMKNGLTGAGAVDVIDFDMCLMAGYETLVKLTGLASFAVFSEEVVPGEGNPYTSIIDAIQANPTMDGRTLASTLVDRFNASYQGNKASTTKSAYDLAGFASFETALNDLATTLQGGLPGLGSTISQAASVSQKFTIAELTDLVNFLDSLNVRVAGQAALQAQIAALKTQATAAAFRINTQARTGTGSTQQGGVADVSRATGLTVVLPSGSGQDAFAQAGTNSLSAYQTLFAGKAWTSFLTAYAGGQTTTAVTDQGNNRFEGYLVWDPNAVAAGADVDFWVLEPNGNIYIPAFGSVTPNGTMSNDSYLDGVNFEGYVTNRFVEKGDYLIMANLWRDPGNFQPRYDLAYRNVPTALFTFLFGSPEPVLSLQTSWLNDPTPTIAEVVNGNYTDLQAVSVLTVSLRQGVASLKSPSARLAGSHALTRAQVATIRRLVSARRSGEAFRTPAALGLWNLPSATQGGQ
jgi:hypothetical protein